MRDKKQTIILNFVLVGLCCYFMQFLNVPNILTVVIGAMLCLTMVIQQKKIRIDVGICLLTLTLASYYVIVNGVRGAFFPILYIPLVIYLLAQYAVNIDKSEQSMVLLIFAFVIGYAVHGILNAYMYYAGYVIPGTRQWQDFWTGAIVPGTQHTAYFLPVLAMFFPAVAYFKKGKAVNVIIIAATVFFGYTSLVTKSRMSVLIFALTILVQLIIFALNEKEVIKRLIFDKWFWVAVGALLVVIVAGMMIIKDTPVVAAFIENMGKGGGILNNVRFTAQRMALEQLLEYPMGGRLMNLGRMYCHNTWLDMANAGGLIPFSAFTAYTVYTVYEIIRLIANRFVLPEIKVVLVGLYAAFFLYLSVEPALDASIHLVTPWIFVNGLVHGLISKKS